MVIQVEWLLVVVIGCTVYKLPGYLNAFLQLIEPEDVSERVTPKLGLRHLFESGDVVRRHGRFRHVDSPLIEKLLVPTKYDGKESCSQPQMHRG